MQITVFGVSRPTGAHAAKTALDHGHTVVVLVRGGPNAVPDSVTKHPQAERLTILTGDATDVDDLKRATEGSDAVLNLLGGRGNIKTTILSDSTKVRNLTNRLTKALIGILPPTVTLIMYSNVGVGESRQYQNFLVKFLLVDWYMIGILKDKLDAETALAKSHITKWTALRAGRLVDRPENLDKVKFVNLEDARVTAAVSREDIAVVALKLAEGGYGDEYWGKAINVESGGCSFLD